MFCETCGQPLDPQTRFCEACGQAAPASETHEGAPHLSPPSPAPERPRPHRQVFPWLAGMVALVICGALLAGYYWGATRQGQPAPTGPAAVPATPPPEAAATPPPPRPDSLTGAEEVHTIGDIAQWHHPVKNVLKKFKVEIHKVELRNNKTYPIFHVTFPYDPWFAHNNNFFQPLYYETLRANGFWDYSFVDESSQCTIHISWDKKSQTMTEKVN